MNRDLRRLWTEEDGAVLSTEMVMYGTLGVVGMGAGYTALRDSVNSELCDLAKAIGALDQSYCFSPVVGHHAYTAGSSFYDRADLPDGPQPLPMVHPLPDRPIVCADVFGPPHVLGHGRPVPSITAPLPGLGSLPEPGAAGVDAPRRDGKKDSKKSDDKKSGAKPTAAAVGSKGVSVVESVPAVVAGSHDFVPYGAPLMGEVPVNTMIHPGQFGPYMIDVPEGYFNRAPGAWMGTPAYNVYVGGLPGPAPANFGHHYGPPPAHHGAPHHEAVPHGRPGWDTIDLGFAKVGDDELKDIDQFKTAKCLHVLGSNVTDKGLGYIADLEELESLHIVGTQITDGGLKQLRSLKKLRFLHLVGTQVTDAGLVHLKDFKSLEELDVRGSTVTPVGLAELSKSMPTLRVIR